MHRIVVPFGASFATCSAAVNVAPADVPTRIPSFCASSRLSREEVRRVAAALREAVAERSGDQR